MEEHRLEAVLQIVDGTRGYLQKALIKLGKELDKKKFDISAVALIFSFYGRVGGMFEHIAAHKGLERVKNELEERQR